LWFVVFFVLQNCSGKMNFKTVGELRTRKNTKGCGILIFANNLNHSEHREHSAVVSVFAVVY